MWTKPAATEMRFGFEVTMYVMNKQWYISGMNTKLTSKDLPRPFTSECGSKVGYLLWKQDDVGSSPTTQTI